MKFSIQRKQLKAVSRFAATKDIRYYLQAVCVTRNARGTVIEATNGHVMGRMLVDRVRAENGPQRVLIGLDTVDKLKGTKKQANEYLHFTVDGMQIEVITPDATMRFQAVDGQFPDTDRVQPTVIKDEDIKPSHFNPEYLLLFSLAGEDLTGKKQLPRIFQRGSDAAVVVIEACDQYDFVGVLMPIRDNVLGGMIPEWIFEPANRVPENLTAVETAQTEG